MEINKNKNESIVWMKDLNKNFMYYPTTDDAKVLFKLYFSDNLNIEKCFEKLNSEIIKALHEKDNKSKIDVDEMISLLKICFFLDPQYLEQLKKYENIFKHGLLQLNQNKNWNPTLTEDNI